jgi:outer membrane protein assembly factor BamB
MRLMAPPVGASALNASTGANLWSYPTSSDVGASPAVVNGVMYVGDTNGNLCAFGLKKGRKKLEAVSKALGLKMLRPALNLQVSQPVATSADRR